MARVNAALLGFNAGALSPEALTRTDLERVKFAEETMVNWLPRVTGSKFVRPGMGFLGQPRGGSATQMIPFVFNASETAVLELTADFMRVWVDDELVSRESVSSAVANSAFTSDLASWTDEDDTGTVSQWVTGGYLGLTGTGFAYARRTQQVTVSGGDIGTEHALRVVVERGPVLFKVGSASGGDDYVAETVLRTGNHSLAFTPTGNFHISVYSSDPVFRLVDSITVESSGAIAIATPWDSSAIGSVRHDQSGDVVFCAYRYAKQQRIERRSQRSWSVCDYKHDDGPFTSTSIARLSLTPSDVTGNITLTASSAVFDSGHVGALFELTHPGQIAVSTLTGEDQFTDYIRVTGTTTAFTRNFTVTISGTFSGTLTLQRAFGTPSAWIDVKTYTGATTDTLTDPYENEIVYYRVGFKTGDYTSGSADAEIVNTNSIQTGIVRITAFSSSTSVSAEVLTTLGKAEATTDWREGFWSDYRGFPASVVFHDGRLWWGGADKAYGSVSDAFESFDQTTEGDSAPIIRSVATGPADSLYWMKSLARLLVGGPSQEVSIRASSFDEPLTPTQFTAKRCSTLGSKDIDAADIDNECVFAQRDGRRVFALAFSPEVQDYAPTDLTRLNPEICGAGVARIAVQRQPETRIWCVLDDGTAAVLTYAKADGVVGWSKVERNGDIEDICVLPGADEDDIYFVINRSGFRTVEKLAKESECVGGALNKIADSFIVYTGAATTTISVGTHLNAYQVVVWANGVALHDQSDMKTVSSGTITLSSAQTNVVVGIPYTAQSKSMKLAFGAELGTALTQKKRVDHLGLILRNTAWKGIRIGRDFSNLRAMSKMRNGKEVDDDAVFDYYDESASSFDGLFDVDSRVCMEVGAPYPATVVALVVQMVTNEKGMEARR